MLLRGILGPMTLGPPKLNNPLDFISSSSDGFPNPGPARV